MSKLCSPSALDSLCLSSTSSDPVSSSSLSTGASSRNSELMPAEDCSTFHRVMSCLDEKKFDLINQNSISSVRSIASRMIQAGFTERLRETFTDLSQELIRWAADNNSAYFCFLSSFNIILHWKQLSAPPYPVTQTPFHYYI
jgi:hypothetical protein